MVHWRSPEMQPFQSHPERQFAFILNLEQHWFTIRRFGVADDLENATQEEATRCHWFNLDSAKPAPEWISGTFLGMILQQAESEGRLCSLRTRVEADGAATQATAFIQYSGLTLLIPWILYGQRQTMWPLRYLNPIPPLRTLLPPQPEAHPPPHKPTVLATSKD
jgi:hypothetical protein